MNATTGTTADSFVITRLFNAPLTRVWDAWTKPDQLGRWFGPKGTTAKVMTHDPRPGGLLHFCLGTPDGGQIWAKLAYREVSPPSRLVWVHSFSDEHANVVRAPFFDGKWPLELLTTVTLVSEGAGTRVTLTWTPINATDLERETFAANVASMNQGWTGSFDKLEGMLARD